MKTDSSRVSKCPVAGIAIGGTGQEQGFNCSKKRRRNVCKKVIGSGACVLKGHFDLCVQTE